MSSRPVRSRQPPTQEPRRSGSNRGENPHPVRHGSTSRSSEGPTRNKSLPSAQRKSSGGVNNNDDAPKGRKLRKEAVPARGVNRAHSGGGNPLKGRKAATERASTGTGRPESRVPKSPGVIGTPSSSGRKARKVATPVSGTMRPPMGTRSSSGDKIRARSRSADRKVSARHSEKEREDAPQSARKGRRNTGGRVTSAPVSAPAPPFVSPGGKSSPSVAGRKVRRAVPDKRGVTTSKSLPTEQLRKVERIRQGQDKQNPKFYKAPTKRSPDEDTSSEEESSAEEASSSEEESSSSESSIEPTETQRYGSDFNDHDSSHFQDNDDGCHYSGNFDFSDDDDISFGPPPQIGGRIVYPGGIVVEDASDSEHEFEHDAPSRNRRPDIRHGDDWLQPVVGSYSSKKSFERASSTATTSSSASGSDNKTNSKKSTSKKVRRSEGGKTRDRDETSPRRSGTSPKRGSEKGRRGARARSPRQG